MALSSERSPGSLTLWVLVALLQYLAGRRNFQRHQPHPLKSAYDEIIISGWCAEANRYGTINDVLNYYQLTTMQSALYSTGKQWIANGQPDGITFFVPTNAAFTAMLARENMTAQQMYANPSALGDLIEAHIVPTSYVCSALQLMLGVPLPTGVGRSKRSDTN